jgi:DNA-binding response OmpR family regulator
LKQVLAPILNGAGISAIQYAVDFRQAVASLGLDGPHLVFIDFDPAPEVMLDLVRLIRRRTLDWDYKMPIVLLSSGFSQSQLMAVRDAGVNEILLKPITIATVMDRLSRVILKPRPFVVSERFVGPCRRRRSSVAFGGPFRRRADPQTAA